MIKTSRMETIVYQNINLIIPKRYAIPDLLVRFKNNTYESEESQLLNYLDKNDTVLELGACLGYLTNRIAKLVNTIVAVEANPELITALEQSSKLNNNSNIKIINCIVDTQSTSKEFQTYDLVVAGSADRNDLLNEKAPNKWGKGVRKYTIPCKQILDLETQYNCNFNTMIIDIEGGEYIFFQQHKNYLKTSINKLIVELHGRFMEDTKFNDNCLNLLQDCGFKILKKIGNTIYCEKAIKSS